MNDVGARAGASTPIPADRPVALLLRHAERPELPVGLPGDDVPLTPRGRREAQALGEALGARLSGLSTSPVRRCVETAEAIRDGAGLVAVARPDPMLGAPGAFVEDADLAWSTWLAWGHQAVIEALVGTRPTPPGFADPAPAARRLASKSFMPRHNWIWCSSKSLIAAPSTIYPAPFTCWPWRSSGS